jgi:predicted nuclease with TOPRIM domain
MSDEISMTDLIRRMNEARDVQLYFGHRDTYDLAIDRLQTLQADLKQRDESITEQASTIVELQGENEALKSNLDQTEGHLDWSRNDCKKLTAENKALEGMNANQKVTIEAAALVREELEDENKQLTTDAARLREFVKRWCACVGDGVQVTSKCKTCRDLEEALNPKEK